MKQDCDALIVGARAAGAPLAARLAKAGWRVMLIDRARLPSDQPLSTHLLGSAGMRELAQLNLAEAVERLAPPINTLRIRFAQAQADIPLVSPSYCLSRAKLDPLLLRAADQAGAQIRPQTRLLALCWENGRIVGATLKDQSSTYTVRARIVIGADGPQSTVARLSGLPAYYQYPFPRAAYWAYWEKPAAWDSLTCQAYTEYSGKQQLFAFPLEENRLVILSALGHGDPLSSREGYLQSLSNSATLAPLIAQSQPVSKILGLRHGEYAIRKPIGPGVALVGDAGWHEDPVSASGISNALRDARLLAQVLLEQAPLAQYWQQRDRLGLEGFLMGQLITQPRFVCPASCKLLAQIGQDPILQKRFARHLDKKLWAGQVVPWRQALSVLHRHPGFLLTIGKMGRRLKRLKKVAQQGHLA